MQIMKMLILILMVFATAPDSSIAREVPPAGSKPLSEILKMVEELKIGVITEAEFEEAMWEVMVREAQTCWTLFIDPKSGNESRRVKEQCEDETPPSDGKRVSEIVRGCEERKLGVITEVEFDDGWWEVSVRNGNRKMKLKFDPKTGEQRR
jgi:hypothetical protein